MDQRPASPRPRPRAFSFRSDKTTASSKPAADDLHDSPKDNQRRDSLWKTSSKANPNAAMNEAQPGGMLKPSAP